MAEAAALGIEHRQPGVVRADPDAVLRIHVHAPDHVVAQAVADPPDAEAHTVVARQAVAGGDPQITLTVLGDAVDAVGRQPVEHAQLARLGSVQRGGHGGAGAGQP
jgi:hypothetical protein